MAYKTVKLSNPNFLLKRYWPTRAQPTIRLQQQPKTHMTQRHLPNGRRSEFLEEKKTRIESLKENKIQPLKITTNNFKSQHPQREKKKEKEDIIIKFPRLVRSTWHRSMGEEVHRETSNPQNPSFSSLCFPSGSSCCCYSCSCSFSSSVSTKTFRIKSATAFKAFFFFCFFSQ